MSPIPSVVLIPCYEISFYLTDIKVPKPCALFIRRIHDAFNSSTILQ
jgi:hypothetical protein